jgi:hypothetical protein
MFGSLIGVFWPMIESVGMLLYSKADPVKLGSF